MEPAKKELRPFRQFIVKLHSRCNLSCDYCYVYEHADQSWRQRPLLMSEDTVRRLAARIGDHVRRHDLPRIVVILHGGEPLLAGPGAIEATIMAIRSSVPFGTTVDVSLQTNGTLLNNTFLELFHRQRISVGVSVDGGGAAHDRHRRYADGRSSFAAVRRTLATLASPEHRELYAGLLCTVDLSNDPVDTYEALLAFAPPQIELLLPLGNWVHRPPGRASDSSRPYADWLIRVFDRWFDAPRRETGVRVFESLIALLVGGGSDTEAVGLDAANAITIETDGSLEVTDSLKTTAEGLGAIGLTVHANDLDEAATHPAVRANQRRLTDLAAACRACPVVKVCGGGQYAHRFGPDGTFDHRSVYCADLYALIAHIRRRLEAELWARRARRPALAG
jgi:uncharacterized protein